MPLESITHKSYSILLQDKILDVFIDMIFWSFYHKIGKEFISIPIQAFILSGALIWVGYF